MRELMTCRHTGAWCWHLTLVCAVCAVLFAAALVVFR